MTKEEAGKRYDYYYKFNSKKKEYDVYHNGVLQYLMSSTITNSTNPILKYVLAVIDNSLVFIMRYIDRLKNFKNFLKFNR